MDLEIIFGKIAEKQIQEAIEEGKFDNLPGKGKPIVFEDDPMTPPHLRMANKILRNAGVLPDWIQAQKDIVAERQEIEKQRKLLAGENQKRRVRLVALAPDHALVRDFAIWHTKSRAAYLKRLKDVNTAILKFSMTAPSTAPAFKPYNITQEMEAFDADFPPLDNQPSVSVPADADADRVGIRGIARHRYDSATGAARDNKKEPGR